MDIAIKHCIINIDALTRSVSGLMSSGGKLQQVQDVPEEIWGMINQMLNAKIGSLILEYKLLRTLAEGDTEVKSFIETLNPFWEEIDKYEPRVLAMKYFMSESHNRDSDFVFAPWWHEFKGKGSPLTAHDIQHLALISVLSNNILCSKYLAVIDEFTREQHEANTEFVLEMQQRSLEPSLPGELKAKRDAIFQEIQQQLP
ncbi:MAG: hypothetical protein EOP51_08910, partial [Sphingobacteriales bacterium]